MLFLPHSYLLFSSVISIGILCLVLSNDLILTLFSIELINFSLYLLCSGFLLSEISLMAAFKFLLIGTLSSSLLLLSIIVYYCYSGLVSYSMFHLFNGPCLLFLIGITLKLGLFPMHFWLSDVYEGSPFTVWIATIPKATILFVTYNLVCFNGSNPLVLLYCVPISLLSILVGSIVMGSQLRVKRFIGMSSLSHLGYLLLSAVVVDLSTFVLYLVFYMLTVLLLFESLRVNSFSSLSIGLFIVSGMPPAIGFFAKVSVLLGLLDIGLWFIFPLVILCSTVSMCYYIKCVKLSLFYNLNSVVGNYPLSYGLLCSSLILFGFQPGSLLFNYSILCM